MLQNLVFILALLASSACASHMAMTASPDIGARPMWTNSPGSRPWWLMIIGGNVGALAGIPTVVWGFMHMPWYFVILAIAISLPLGMWRLEQRGAEQLLAIVASPVLCIILWCLT